MCLVAATLSKTCTDERLAKEYGKLKEPWVFVVKWRAGGK